MISVFLSGGLKSNWQDEARFVIDSAGVTVRYFDPRHWQNETTTPNEYTKRDIDAIKDSQIVLAYMDPTNPSGFGLSVELGYASALGRTIVFCDEVRHDFRSPYFGMHRALADYHAQTLIDGCRAVIRFARNEPLGGFTTRPKL